MANPEITKAILAEHRLPVNVGLNELHVMESFFAAADTHGENSGDSDYTVGDLQELLRAAWMIMMPSQKIEFLNSPEAEALIEVAGDDAFNLESLKDPIDVLAAEKEKIVTAAGYYFTENEVGHKWETEDFEGGEFRVRIDAVHDAYEWLTTGN